MILHGAVDLKVAIIMWIILESMKVIWSKKKQDGLVQEGKEEPIKGLGFYSFVLFHMDLIPSSILSSFTCFLTSLLFSLSRDI